MNTYLTSIGIKQTKAIHRNLPSARLTELALEKKEALLSNTGALVINTGKFSGRTAKDKFVVDTPAIHDDIDWGAVNKPMSLETYQHVRARVCAHLENLDIFIFDGFAGADDRYKQNVRVINESATQTLFIQNLLLRPTASELLTFSTPDITIIVAPYFYCDAEKDGTNSEAAILFNIEAKEVIICGTAYSGEIKKSVFTLMNYLLPKQNVLPMHCSANVNDLGEVAVFFGLSGTGKTTLSADPSRKLIGDDEHGWSDHGVFNIEGGLYAKCLNLTEASEPEIWHAIRAGSVVENVVMDNATREFDFDDASLSENSRVGYPLEFVPHAVMPPLAGHPNVLIFLTADAFGVLPPVAKLDKEQAKYHFISGYTSKVAGTEMGVDAPQTTFSTCFGAPFLPLAPHIYADMLGKKMDEHKTDVYLINTGWSGGAYGTGKRMSLRLTRAIVTAALNGDLQNVEYVNHPIFNIDVPQSCPGIDALVLNPRDTWENPTAYDKAARNLADRFIANFEKYDTIPTEIIEAGPRV